jgi:hypothetical protein
MDIEDQSVDPVIEAYKAGIDMTLIRENLRRTPEERLLATRATATLCRGISERWSRDAPWPSVAHTRRLAIGR